MYGCERWTIKKAECRRIDTFEVWCWRRLLRVPWTARRSNQSILKEISPEYSLEGLMLKLKLQYFGHLMQRTDSLEDPDAGKDWRQEEKGMAEDEMAGWHHWLDGHGFGWTPGIADGQGGLACCSSWGHRVRHDWVTEPNWTERDSIVEWVSPLFPVLPIPIRETEYDPASSFRGMLEEIQLTFLHFILHRLLGGRMANWSESSFH